MPENYHEAGGRRSSPIRRIRQACVNCRRKKSKCPGERPQCSICKRLEQTCTYESFEPESRKRRRSHENARDDVSGDEFSRRFGSIEQKLEELAASVEKVAPVSNKSHQPPSLASDSTYQPQTRTIQGVTESDSGFQQQQSRSNLVPQPMLKGRQLQVGSEILPADVIEDGVRTYFRSFHAQPYSLMCRKSSLQSLHALDPAVLNPMLALSIRCSSHPFWADQSKLRRWMHALTEKSWRDLLYYYGEGDTSLQYLQGLCLLAQVDFADGRVQRAHTQISLGVRIAQSAGYLAAPDSDAAGLGSGTEEVVRCTWTLFMLDRAFSITRHVSPSLSYQDFQLRKPTWEGALSLSTSAQDGDINALLENDLSTHEQDLAALTVGVYSIWDDVIRYVFQTTNDNTMPPWQPGSELATIEYRFADFEPEFSTHRYREVGFPRRAIHEPHLRPYFASWLCFQLSYMSIQCCIHHPFIMFIKLQHVIRKVPPSFLQKSYKSSLIHSRWIIRFLDEMDEAGMMLYDPFIGYLTAIAATIQLEHTLSKHSDIATAARLSFRSAIRFLRKLSTYWNSIQELLEIVEELAARLRHRHTLYYSQDDYDGILPAVETERVGLAGDDVTLMWKVFDYASMSALKGRVLNHGHHTADPIHQEGDSHLQATADDLSNISGNFRVSQSSGVPLPSITSASAPSEPVNFPNVHRPADGILDPPNLALFDQIPEDWAFTIDDWTLFGAPGSTYFYNEGS